MAEQNGDRPGASPRSSTETRRASRVLGSLETQLMDVLWKSQAELSVQEVCDALGPGHNYKTVMTVLNRLVDKELLARQLDGRAYRYHPQQPRADFLRLAADELVHVYLDTFGEEATAQLTGAVDAATGRTGSAATGRPGPNATPPSPPPSAPPSNEGPRTSPLAIIAIIAAVVEGLVLVFGRKRRSG